MLHTYSMCVLSHHFSSSIHHSHPSLSAYITHTIPSVVIYDTVVSVYVMCVYCLQVRSSILAKLEPKYQNSSLRAIADSNSFLTRLRVGGGGEGRGGGGAGSLPRAPPTGRERGGHYQRQQRLLNEARMEARNHMTSHEQGPTTSIDCKCHRHSIKMYRRLTYVYRSMML